MGLLVQTGVRIAWKSGSDARVDRVGLNGPLMAVDWLGNGVVDGLGVDRIG